MHLFLHMMSIVIGQPVGLMMSNNMDVVTTPSKGNLSAQSKSTQLDEMLFLRAKHNYTTIVTFTQHE
jgi:hypothetical protein